MSEIKITQTPLQSPFVATIRRGNVIVGYAKKIGATFVACRPNFSEIMGKSANTLDEIKTIFAQETA